MAQNKKLMLGNQAVARGLHEAGCSFVSSYPGTPSSEITKFAALEEGVYAEWAPNEKVALEGAIGASFAGVRAFSAMKHVGLNVAADPLFTVAYTGVNGGLVVAVADDMGCHSSQNEQDSRHYARAAKVPMLEPADSEECRIFTRMAFEISEEYDTPVLLRLSTRISHSRTLCGMEPSVTYQAKNYVKNASKFVMVPAAARPAHAGLEKRMIALQKYSEDIVINTIEWGNKREIGVIASGIAYQATREALGDDASYLKLGMIYPLPLDLIKKLSESVDELWVIEELDDFIETHCRKNGIEVNGKESLSLLGEYTVQQIRQAVLSQRLPEAPMESALPIRPPIMCPGCSHRAAFHIIKKLKLTVMGDIGCYTLGSAPPLSAMDFCVCMGASVSALHGFLKSRPEYAEKTVGVIGDSTFLHTGINGLMNIVYNQTPATLLILDNSTTGMTGHQDHPGTGKTLDGTTAYAVDLEALCRSVGVSRVKTADPFDLDATEKAIKEELDANEPSVVILKRPCALLPVSRTGCKYKISEDKCTKCRRCLGIACPALQFGINGGIELDANICSGCGLCAKLCKFGAIVKEDSQV